MSGHRFAEFCSLLSVLTICSLVLWVPFGQGSEGTLLVTPLKPYSIIDGGNRDALEFDGNDGEYSMTAAVGADGRMASSRSDDLVSVIVKIEEDALASYRGSVPGFEPTTPAITGGGRLDTQSMLSRNYMAHLDHKINALEFAAVKTLKTARVVHRYRTVLGGVSMLVPRNQVGLVRELPGVKEVYLDEMHQLLTDSSPKFVRADRLWSELGGWDVAGEGVIVGVIDTGIWPEHPSFSDPDPRENPYPPPPAEWLGFCEAPEDGSAPVECNNKLIGARKFLDGYKSVVPLQSGEFDSPRDSDGHGTHTAGTAAGNAGVTASILGASHGTVSGIAPRAHVAVYRACAALGCTKSDLLAAVEQAVADGVDVINYSIGPSSPRDPYTEPIDLAFLDAYNAGVFVAASAGNSGPTAGTVIHRGGWVTTVGASTQRRQFESRLRLFSDNRERLNLTGTSVTPGISSRTEVVVAADYGDGQCRIPFPDGTFDGAIVVCESGGGSWEAKSYNVSQGGASGMILYNSPGSETVGANNHHIPTIHLDSEAGALLTDYLSSHTGVKAKFTAGKGRKRRSFGDIIGEFSSRGGPGITMGVIKPDIVAPGVDILAGHTESPYDSPGGGPQGELFEVRGGTSMSSPHVAGAAALLKDLHTDWGPGRIKSALMTCARNEGVVKEDGVTPADPFDMGSGRLDLKRAGRPGVTFDVPGQDFLDHKYDLWNVNYPSLYLPSIPGIMTVTRTAHSETSRDRPWKFEVTEPPVDLKISIPDRIRIPGDSDVAFDINVDARDVPMGEVRHAVITMKSGKYRARFPISMVRGRGEIWLEKSCDPATFPEGETTDCIIEIHNNLATSNVQVVDVLPDQLKLVSGSVIDAIKDGNGLSYDGIVESAEIRIVNGTAPKGYVPLGAWLSPIPGIGDETIVNFDVLPFKYLESTYRSIGIVSNGYVVIGGGTAEDVSREPVALPNPAAPNNVIAPFWTDLDPSQGGNLYAAYIRDDSVGKIWLVLEWQDVPEIGSLDAYTFQLWIEVNSDNEDISMVYARVDGNGDDTAGLVVGAENKTGVIGDTWDDVPTTEDELKVEFVPGEHTISFRAQGVMQGKWTNYAEMTGDTFQGTSIASFAGEVTQ